MSYALRRGIIQIFTYENFRLKSPGGRGFITRTSRYTNNAPYTRLNFFPLNYYTAYVHVGLRTCLRISLDVIIISKDIAVTLYFSRSKHKTKSNLLSRTLARTWERKISSARAPTVNIKSLLMKLFSKKIAALPAFGRECHDPI